MNYKNKRMTWVLWVLLGTFWGDTMARYDLSTTSILIISFAAGALIQSIIEYRNRKRRSNDCHKSSEVVKVSRKKLDALIGVMENSYSCEHCPAFNGCPFDDSTNEDSCQDILKKFLRLS